jgi:hypothetical protein
MIQKVWKNMMTKLIHCTTKSRNRIGGGGVQVVDDDDDTSTHFNALSVQI